MPELVLEALLRLIGSILRALLSLVTDPIVRSVGYRTAKVLMPVLSLGAVCVEDSRFRSLGLYKRTARGIVLHGEFATFLGLMLWIGALVLAAVIYTTRH
jgi:hypothetical protein